MEINDYKLKRIEMVIRRYIGGFSNEHTALSEISEIINSKHMTSENASITDLDTGMVVQNLKRVLIKYN